MPEIIYYYKNSIGDKRGEKKVLKSDLLALNLNSHSSVTRL